MEREKELTKLVNVLRRTARTAMQVEWTGGDEGAVRACVERYNRVLERLKELEPSLERLFDPLSEDTTPGAAAVACRQLAAYFEDEAGEGFPGFMGAAAAIDPESFKEFWRRSAVDIEDLGEHIRETVHHWARQRKRRWREGEPASERANEQERQKEKDVP